MEFYSCCSVGNDFTSNWHICWNFERKSQGFEWLGKKVSTAAGMSVFGPIKKCSKMFKGTMCVGDLG